jgi:hypothetical protein
MYEAIDNAADARRKAMSARVVGSRLSRMDSSKNGSRGHNRAVASLSDRRMKLVRALSGHLH